VEWGAKKLMLFNAFAVSENVAASTQNQTISGVDGLTGFPEAIKTIFPKT